MYKNPKDPWNTKRIILSGDIDENDPDEPSYYIERRGDNVYLKIENDNPVPSGLPYIVVKGVRYIVTGIY